MPDTVHQFGGTKVLLLAAEDAPIVERPSVIDMISAVASHQADIVAVPVARQGSDFFDLKTRLAGEMLQVCVNYGIRLAFVGDLSDQIAASGALRDFVYESNKGNQVWFVDDLGALERKLAG